MSLTGKARIALAGTLAACAVAATVTVGAAGASDEVTAAATESTFPLADPDTLRAEDGRYVTYGTTVGAGRGKRCGGVGKLWVPILTHGSGNTVGMTDCASGDALPGGPGDWASGNIWAPGVVRFGDRFFMFYTAARKGSGQKCLGRAISRSAYGPFRNAGGWACPSTGRWAIDANPFVAGGRMYVAYRDDAITSGPETGISVVRTDGEGRAEWPTRRDALKSTHVTWDSRRATGTTNVIENPSMFKAGDYWFLAYSGNNWDSPRYATGIAKCGTGPLPGTRCTPLRDGVSRPYFGFTGDGGLGPYRGLPGNHRGPGGMDVFTAADGGKRVVYHWWNGTSRFPMTGTFDRDSGGFRVR